MVSGGGCVCVCVGGEGGLVVTLSARGDCKHLFLQETNHAGVHSTLPAVVFNPCGY